MPRRIGFTLIELLVSIGLIALLISLVIVSVRGVQRAANRTEALSGLRNLMRAHATYGTDHRQHLLPGYLDEPALAELDIDAKTVEGTTLANLCDAAGRCDASGYVWRLAPYLDDSWRSVMTDYRSAALTSELEREWHADIYGPGSATGASDLGIASIPAFGLNSIFVGGDTFHGDAGVIARNPYFPADPSNVIAATNLSQVRNPGRVTVFATVMQATNSSILPSNPPAAVSDLTFGHPELRPPFLDWADTNNDGTVEFIDVQWQIDPATRRIVPAGGDFSKGGGWPIGRAGEDQIPVGHLDGSTEAVDRDELATDFTRWSPFATGIR